MTIQDLDRLVTKTSISPASKRALKEVRKAVMSGACDDPRIGPATWSISLDTSKGLPVHLSFSFRRDE